MRAIALLPCALAIVACSKAEEAPRTDSPAAAPATVGPAAVSMADLVGKWKQETRREGSDSVLVTSEINATADPAGWTITLPGRPPMPVRVTVAGDSIMTATGPYESVLRKGVQVTTEGVARIQDGKMVGTTTARYSGGGPDSVVRLRQNATRIP